MCKGGRGCIDVSCFKSVSTILLYMYIYFLDQQQLLAMTFMYAMLWYNNLKKEPNI